MKHTTQEYKHGAGALLLFPVVIGSILIAEHIGMLPGLVFLFGATYKLVKWLERTDPTRKRGTFEVLPSGEVRHVIEQ